MPWFSDMDPTEKSACLAWSSRQDATKAEAPCGVNCTVRVDDELPTVWHAIAPGIHNRCKTPTVLHFEFEDWETLHEFAQVASNSGPRAAARRLR